MFSYVEGGEKKLGLLGGMMPSKPYIVIYAKITESKEEGPRFQGPFISTQVSSLEEAERECRRLSNEQRSAAMIPRIYERQFGEEDRSVLNRANNTYFDKVRVGVEEASEVYNRGKTSRKVRK